MANKRFNLVLNEEQMYYLSLALECAMDNEEQADQELGEYYQTIKKIKERLDK